MPEKSNKIPNLAVLVICLFSPLLLAECVSLSVPNPTVVLKGLNLPHFVPPNLVFALVWFSLYLIMGFSLYFILTFNYKSQRLKRSLPLYFFAQLAVNYLWFISFFAFQYRGLAVLLIILLMALVIAVLKRLREISAWLSRLWIFYLIWLFFAAFLNYTIWIMNL